jgi:4-diphosphocytidyl-2-C-methyl-D-erythritol kinase
VIVFPNSKINLGLQITEKRTDGFHNIDSVFYPVAWEDALEIIESRIATSSKVEFNQSGIISTSTPEENLVVKAYNLLDDIFDLPPVKIHLHKTIPTGAGLGGGSADAAFTLKCINELYGLQLEEEQLMNFARKLGSDCAFFIKNTPVCASERGDIFHPATINLKKYSILLVWPGIHSNTAQAYQKIQPKKPVMKCEEICSLPVKEWKFHLKNDFEVPLFHRYPELKSLKEMLYDAGALYASMSGSGAALFGIFENNPPSLNFPPNFLVKKILPS